MKTDANLAGARPFPPRSVKDGPAVLLHHPLPALGPARCAADGWRHVLRRQMADLPCGVAKPVRLGAPC